MLCFHLIARVEQDVDQYHKLELLVIVLNNHVFDIYKFLISIYNTNIKLH